MQVLRLPMTPVRNKRQYTKVKATTEHKSFLLAPRMEVNNTSTSIPEWFPTTRALTKELLSRSSPNLLLRLPEPFANNRNTDLNDSSVIVKFDTTATSNEGPKSDDVDNDWSQDYPAMAFGRS
ncbi:hypothetical protein BaRGS_00005565 [Batillaria attramentaria]|uniref:Uncharacterized protein n=1 Tax=Batillaria attramentaria TaxID=370345 RepID=A0ABD0LUG3_9CAEN